MEEAFLRGGCADGTGASLHHAERRAGSHDRCFPQQATIPQLTRSSLHRCFQRHGISRLPDLDSQRPAKKKFKVYPIGYLPCGKGLYFWKDTLDPTKFQTPDKEWTGYLNTNGDFTAWRDDGWTILYHQGRLTSITTDEQHVFTWAYDGNTHMATGISEDGVSLVTVEPNQQGLVGAVVFDGKRYELGYAERPLIEMLQGQPVVKQLAIALSSFKYPDGKMEAFKFALTPDRVPTVTFTDSDKKQTLYTWDPATDHIITEKGSAGDWIYTIGAISTDFGQPPIRRTSPDGKTEGMAVDNKTGTYTAQAEDDTTTITHVFETPGPLYHRVKSIEKTSNGVTTTIYKASYDEAGRLIRKVDENNIVTTFRYDNAGNEIEQQVSLSTDPAVLAGLAAQEKTLLQRLKNISDPIGRIPILNDLAIFYTCEALDFDKAKGLESRLAECQER